MAWTVVADLLSLKADFDLISPHRDKGADGTIGDTAHKAESSDHNPDDTAGSRTPHTDADSIPEVHALDIDSTGPWPVPFGSLVGAVRNTMIALGADAPLAYIIYNHHIYYKSNGWAASDYNLADPHTNHAHFSSLYGSGSGTSNPENYAGPWGLEAYMPLTDADFKGIIKAFQTVDGLIAGPDLAASVKDKSNPTWTVGGFMRDVSNYVRVLEGHIGDVEAKLDLILSKLPK